MDEAWLNRVIHPYLPSKIAFNNKNMTILFPLTTHNYCTAINHFLVTTLLILSS